jgi:DNA-binding winged helix-turn-helix (wHTH) protein/tetratricopeptide (TPR) repeat protein
VTPVPIYQFGEFRLDAATRALCRAGEPVALPPKVFDCIVYLLEHRERAVGRDELIAAIWGKVDVADSVLGQTILLARRALDDTGREQHVIRTVVRFGYHWLAAVTVAAEGDMAGAPGATTPPSEIARPPSPDVTAAARPATRWRPALIALALFVGAIAGLSAWWGLRDSAPQLNTLAARNAMLVLPVEVVGTTDAAWVRLGVMDLVASRLRESGQPIVPSDNVVALARAYEHATSDPAQLRALADAAAAGLVIDARAEMLQGRWRVSLRSLLGRAPVVAVSAESSDVLAAARDATDRLAMAIGLPAHAPSDPDRMVSLDPFAQKIEAALLEERSDVVRALLDQADPEQRNQPAMRLQRARADFQSGDLDAAVATFRNLVESVPAADDPVLHAQALNALGGIAVHRQQPAAALPQLDQAIDLLVHADAPALLGKAYGNRAAAHALLHENDAALADLAQSRIALATAGDALGLAVIDSNTGAFAMNRDRFADAAPILENSADRFAAFRAYAAELNARGNAALVQLALLDPTAALASAERMAELVDKVQDPDRRRAANLIRVQVLYANGRLQAAEYLLREVRADASADAPALARVQAISAHVALARGDAALAAREATASLAVPPVPQDPRETALTWLSLVRARLASGDDSGAEQALADAQFWAERDGSPAATLHVALAKAERMAHARAPASEVRAVFEQAHALAERGRVPTDLLTVSQPYLAWLMEQHDFDRASTIAEGVASWAARDYDTSLLQLRLLHALNDPTASRSVLARTRNLAGERRIPPEITPAP